MSLIALNQKYIKSDNKLYANPGTGASLMSFHHCRGVVELHLLPTFGYIRTVMPHIFLIESIANTRMTIQSLVSRTLVTPGDGSIICWQAAIMQLSYLQVTIFIRRQPTILTFLPWTARRYKMRHHFIIIILFSLKHRFTLSHTVDTAYSHGSPEAQTGQRRSDRWKSIT